MRGIGIFLVWAFLQSAAVGAVVDTWAFSSPQAQSQALSVAASLRCPQCQNQNLLESTAPVAVTMRHTVFRMTEEGKTPAEIADYMAARYGDFVRYQPPLRGAAWLLWALPPLLFVALAAALWRWRRRLS
ncbi:cytochrome c-type biogenesis protein CcmH [Enterobacteriaceae bacterium YMB-R22]|jgi:formate-dependent nitrite reductase complex subunit NrfF|uniref:cytochrome c-type biogenesis protein CcmH n=1 Tax=Tenebrionicola larvae TaxID=2815733 RepID=UPI002012B46E|nr:cytochrome c-type biogenesis protein CcmH [Tenebrionicola larvae]MBV4411495.1 cytochrome c-type biogenesis protein CcmH [Tenebrionicola larvae]